MHWTSIRPRSTRSIAERLRHSAGYSWFVVAALTTALPAATSATEVPFDGPIAIDVASVPRMAVGDVNGNGRIDLVAVSGTALYWYENLGGGGFRRRLIRSTSNPDVSFGGVRIGDANGDGDIDLFLVEGLRTCPTRVCFTLFSTVILDNASGNGLSWTSLAGYAQGAHALADLDGDGDDDPAFATVNRIFWLDRSTSLEHDIQNGVFAGPIAVADVDGDCDIDVFAVSTVEGLLWLENSNGLGTSWTKHVAADVFDADVIAADDIDHDGHADVVLGNAVTANLRWYRNSGGAGAWLGRDIDLTTEGFVSLTTGDVDGNGSVDVLAVAADGDSTVWYENAQGAGTAWLAHVITDATPDTTSAFVADLDGDRRNDVVYNSEASGINWWNNLLIRRSAVFSESLPITNTADGASSVAVTDIDGDGDPDVVSASAGDNVIRWHQNNGAAAPSFVARTIATGATGAISVTTGDVDGDGDVDVIAALEPLDDIVWYANDGTPAIGSWFARNIAIGASGVRSVAAGDIDCDGDVDVVSADYDAGRVRLWRNNGANPPSWTVMNISPNGGGPASVALVDFDLDGDLDVVSAWLTDGAVRWHRNENSRGSLWTTFDLATGIVNPTDVYPADLDNDGDADILIAGLGTCSQVLPFSCTGKVLWVQNGSLTLREIDGASPRTTSVYAEDLNADGYLDVLATSASTSGLQANAVRWYENLGGTTPSFSKKSVVSGLLISRPTDVVTADLDRDGDWDVVSASSGDDKVAWYRNGGGQFGVRTADIAPATLVPSATDALLKITISHNGRAVDSDVELLSLDFRFEEAPGDPLDTVQGLTLIEEVSLYRDDLDGTFNPNQDFLVRRMSSPLLSAGILRVGVNAQDGQPEVAVSHGEPGIFFLVVTLTEGAGDLSFGQFRAVHLATAARAHDRTFDMLLSLEETADVATSMISLPRAGDCSGDGHLTLDDWHKMAHCLRGPNVIAPPDCTCAKWNDDPAVDLADVAEFQSSMGPSN